MLEQEKYIVYGKGIDDELEPNERRGSQEATDAFNKALDHGLDCDDAMFYLMATECELKDGTDISRAALNEALELRLTPKNAINHIRMRKGLKQLKD
jgi:hypothetical protein